MDSHFLSSTSDLQIQIWAFIDLSGIKMKANIYFLHCQQNQCAWFILSPLTFQNAAFVISGDFLVQQSENLGIMSFNLLFLRPPFFVCLFLAFALCHLLLLSRPLVSSLFLFSALFALDPAGWSLQRVLPGCSVGMVDNLQHKPPPPLSPSVWSSICLAHCRNCLSLDISCLLPLFFSLCHGSRSSNETNLLDISTFGNI